MNLLETIIKTENLTKKYNGRAVVDHVNLCLRPGEIYGFLGPNGAGKTTTLRMILGLIRPDSGSVNILGKVIDPARRQTLRAIGAVGEHDSFFGDETAGEYLRFFARLRGLCEYEDQIQELLAHFELEDFENLLANRFSQGMKRKLNLIRALIGQPEVLILDEPASGLDPHGIRQVREILVSQRERGCAILISSHILSEVEQTADRVGIIDKGKLLMEDTVESVRNHFVQDTRLTIELQEPLPELLQVLQETQGIKRVCQQGTKLVLDVEPGVDVRAKASERIAEMHGLVIGMHQESTSLEDAFVQITSEGINQLDPHGKTEKSTGSNT